MRGLDFGKLPRFLGGRPLVFETLSKPLAKIFSGLSRPGKLTEANMEDAMATVATQPAKNEPMAAIASAGPARPWRAIW